MADPRYRRMGVVYAVQTALTVACCVLLCLAFCHGEESSFVQAGESRDTREAGTLQEETDLPVSDPRDHQRDASHGRDAVHLIKKTNHHHNGIQVVLTCAGNAWVDVRAAQQARLCFTAPESGRCPSPMETVCLLV